MLLINILFFGALFLFYYGLIFIIRNHHKYRSFIRIAAIYFALLMLLLLLTWPGIWRGPNDDFIIAVKAKHCEFYGWHHVLTSILYMISFKLFPIFSGVLIVQCFIISLITSYIFTSIITTLSIHRRLSKIILFIPFLLPPVLDYALYPLRSTLFAYSVVLLIFTMLKTLFNKNLTRTDLIILIASAILTITWRSEGICYLIIIPIFFLYHLVKKIIPFKPALLSLFIIISGFFCISSLQQTTLRPYEDYGYKILATANTAASLIRRASQEPENSEELSNIDQVLDTKMIIEEKDKTGEHLFYNGASKENITKETYHRYLTSFLKLLFKYPATAIKNNLSQFLLSTSISATLNNTTLYTEYLKDDLYERLAAEQKDESFTASEYREKYINAITFIEEAGPAMQSFNKDLRNVTISILEGREIQDYNKFTPFAVIFWNAIIPIISIITFGIFMLIRKKFIISFISLSILIKTFIVIMTAPMISHMYYYSEYLYGYIILFTMLAYAISRTKKKLIPFRR